MNNQKNISYTPLQALPKIQHFCAYQERCHAEVIDKLYSFGLNKKDIEQIVTQLIEDNYLNEERFARSFVNDKFRFNKWGRKKIEYQLKAKKVSAYNIKSGMKAIDEDDYLKLLQKEANNKLESLKNEKNIRTKNAKVFQYLLGRGFESNLISDVLKIT